MGYLLALRKLVGKQPLISVGASTIILNQDNQVLLIERSDNGLWGLPAGSSELNEAPEQTAVREIAEETGLIVREEALQLVKVFGGSDFFYVYPNEDQCSNIVISYATSTYRGTLISETNETVNANFFSFDQLPVAIAKHEKIILTYYQTTIEPMKES